MRPEQNSGSDNYYLGISKGDDNQPEVEIKPSLKRRLKKGRRSSSTGGAVDYELLNYKMVSQRSSGTQIGGGHGQQNKTTLQTNQFQIPSFTSPLQEQSFLRDKSASDLQNALAKEAA